MVYIAPLKALVRERVLDWTQRVCPKIGRTLVELTGDLTPDLASLQRCARRDDLAGLAGVSPGLTSASQVLFVDSGRTIELC